MAFTQNDQATHKKDYKHLLEIVKSVKLVATKEQRQVAVQILMANPQIMELVEEKRPKEDQNPTNYQSMDINERDFDILINHLKKLNIVEEA